jgi:hypothetical protein
MFNAENHSIICSKIGGQRTLMSMYSAIVCLTHAHAHAHAHARLSPFQPFQDATGRVVVLTVPGQR